MTLFKRGSILELTIESLAMGGKGVAHFNDFTIFVDRAIPGQVVTAQIYRKKRRYADARIIDIIKKTSDEVPAKCSHFGTCGGCRHQNLEYDKQIGYKRDQIFDTLNHVGGFTDIKVENTIPSPKIYHYRNKMEFSFSDKRWLTIDEIANSSSINDKDFALGFHIPGRHDKVLDVKKCFLHSELSNDIFLFIKKWTKKSSLLPYTIDHTGFLRFLIIREALYTKQILINLVTAERPNLYEKVDELQQALSDLFPQITTIVHNINKKKAQIAFGDEERILFGPGYITEKLDDYIFQISANSFFQTNSVQAVNLYNKILEFGQFSKNNIVYDLYCGTGSISIFISKLVNHVVGFELVTQAISDAHHNCQLNNIGNCSFEQGDLRELIKDTNHIISKYGKPDIIVVDPPRSGMHPSLPAKIIELSPEKIVYVSCNPATFARDLKLLCADNYFLQKIQPVDMFPHTPHCEVVALLSRCKK